MSRIRTTSKGDVLNYMGDKGERVIVAPSGIIRHDTSFDDQVKEYNERRAALAQHRALIEQMRAEQLADDHMSGVGPLQRFAATDNKARAAGEAATAGSSSSTPSPPRTAAAALAAQQDREAAVVAARQALDEMRAYAEQIVKERESRNASPTPRTPRRGSQMGGSRNEPFDMASELLATATKNAANKQKEQDDDAEAHAANHQSLLILHDGDASSASYADGVPENLNHTLDASTSIAVIMRDANDEVAHEHNGDCSSSTRNREDEGGAPLKLSINNDPHEDSVRPTTSPSIKPLSIPRFDIVEGNGGGGSNNDYGPITGAPRFCPDTARVVPTMATARAVKADKSRAFLHAIVMAHLTVRGLITPEDVEVDEG